MKKTFLLTVFSSLIFLVSYAQVPPHRTCGTMDNLNYRILQDPGLVQRMQQIDAFTNNYVNHPQPQRSVITIPVVVHVIYNTAAENISDSQVLSQIDVLNQDYHKLNPDWTSTPSVWQSLVADCNIQFCMAQRDPNGNATNGIIRVHTNSTSFSTNDNVKYTAQGGDNAWPATDYLNLWCCNLGSGLLGYSQFPGGAAATDGVVILYTAFGNTGNVAAPYNLGRTATHEVGHWLNLYHIWGDDNGACTGTDQVNDTPNQANMNYGCPTYPLTDACTATAPGVMFMDYMDYTDDACMYMFTNGQNARIQANFASGGPRASILNSQGCVPVIPPAACTGMPSTGSITVAQDTICPGSSTPLALHGSTTGYSGITYLWQQSANGINGWAGANGANTDTFYTTSALSNTTYYRCVVGCSNSGLTASSATVAVYVPGIHSVDNDTTCNGGSITLQANGFGGIHWYADAAGSNILHNGNSFTINTNVDTIFYVNAGTSSTVYGSAGLPSNSAGGGNVAAGTNGLAYKAYSNLVIDTISVYPAGAGNVKVNMVDSASGTTVNTITVAVTAGQAGQKVRIYLGWAATSGHVYQMNANGSTVSGLFRNNAGVNFPYAINGILSIFRSLNNNASRYYFFYDWKLHSVNGCSSAILPVHVHIGHPVVYISASATAICSGDSVVLQANGASAYSWQPGGQSSGTITVHPISNVNYSVIGSVGAGCSDTAYQSIAVTPGISVSASASPDTVCIGGSSVLTATGNAASYQWSPGGLSGAVVTVSSNATTAYTVTGISGACAANASVVVHVDTAHIQTGASGVTICYGNAANLNATGGTGYIWNPGNHAGSSYTVTPLTNTTYTVTATDAFGCDGSASEVISVDHAVVSISSDVDTLCKGNTATLTGSGVTNYSWNPGGNSNVIHVSPSATTTYVLIGTDLNGCSDTASFTLFVKDCSTGVITPSSPSLVAYPNPATDLLTIAYTNFLNGPVQLRLTNTLGQEVWHSSRVIAQSSGTLTIDLNGMPANLYFIHILQQQNDWVLSVIKK